jgi:ATP-dependent DNA ligase
MHLTRNRRRRSHAASPGFVPPQLATFVKRAPDGPGFLHEIKLDGHRMAARLDNGDVRLLARTGLDWTSKYPAIAQALSELPVKSAYLDGELYGVLADGRTAFSIVQNAADRRSSSSLAFFLFDLLFLDGEDLRSLPLIERKDRLKTLLTMRHPVFNSLITSSVKGLHSTGSSAKIVSKGSYRSASTRLTSQAGELGSKSNA